MNTVNKDMRDAEKNLAGLEKCCGLCACPWQKVGQQTGPESSQKTLGENATQR
jgi:synaptosomal-associated protein 25